MKENVCCPKLEIIDCGDTDEYKHFACAFSGAILKNETICKRCICDFKKCLIPRMGE